MLCTNMKESTSSENGTRLRSQILLALNAYKSNIMYFQTSPRYYLPHGFIPNEIDILCGRGKANAKHPGNIVFMATIRSCLNEYTAAGSRVEKSVVVTSVVDNIVAAGMRFIKVDSKYNQHVTLSSERSHEKVGHAIRDLLKQKKNINNKKSTNAMRTCRTKILPDMVHSLGDQNKNGTKTPLSSVVKQQEQHLPESMFSLENVFGEIAENSGELQLVLAGLSENICPKATDNEDIFAILEDDVFSMDFGSKTDIIQKPHNINAAVCPLPLDSKLDLGCLDMEALSGVLGVGNL
jgi:hypothetical protein